jgi:hypothetical protein
MAGEVAFFEHDGTTSLVVNSLSNNQYLDIVKSEIISPRIRIDVLRPDESVNYEIISDIIDNTGNLNISFSNIGTRRTCSLNLSNISAEYIPNPNTSGFWVADKFKLYLGFRSEGIDYWFPNGVFVHKNPSASRGDSSKDLRINAIDKFSLLDGTLSGTITETYFIPINSNIYGAIRTLLATDRGDGKSIDPVEPILESENNSATTTYDIYVEAGGTYKDVLLKLTDQISSYCYYDINGALVVESGTRDLGDNDKGSIYDFRDTELELLNEEAEYRFEEVVNRVVVVGDNINGAIARGVALNNNPFSSTRIGRIPTRSKYVNVSTIDTDQKALDYASLILKELSMLNINQRISCTFMAHLDVNNVITVTDSYFGYESERFLINSISIPLGTNSTISINATNVNQLPFYEGAA